MKFFIVLALALICSVHCDTSSDDIKEEDDVTVLTAGNWDQVVTADSIVLVEFYAPWCGHCKTLAPEYVKAAAKLKELKSDVVLAKVDATVEKELAEKHGVQGFPTLKFYKQGNDAVEYGGGRDAEGIVTWLNKKTGPPAKVVETGDELKSFIESREVSVVGCFTDNDSELATAFVKAAEGVDDVEFAITTPQATGDHDLNENTIVVFKKFDEGRAEYAGDADGDAIAAFVRGESLPLVNEFTQETAPKIFAGAIKSHLLMFLSKKSEEFSGHLETYGTVAKMFKGKVIFVYIDIDTTEADRILQFFVLKKTDCPTLRLLELEGDMKKFVPDTTDLTEEAIAAFVQSYVDGTLKVHLNSEDVPEDWDEKPVKVLVGKNFKEVAMDTTKDAIVEFYAPWCGHCKQLAPIWDKLGEHYKDDGRIVVAKMDSTVNEVEEVTVQSYPTIKYFSKGVQEEYKGGRNFDDFVKFIDGKIAPEGKVEEVPAEEVKAEL